METEDLRQFVQQVVMETITQLGLVREQKSNTTVLTYYENWIEGFKRQVKAGMKSDSTLRKHQRVLQCLREYFKYNKVEDVELKDADKDFLTDFQIYLKSVRKLSVGTIRVYISPVIMIFRHAHDDGITDAYLFRDFRFEHEDCERGFLSKDDMHKLAACECKNNRELLVRDLFLFCCFTGLAFADLKGLCREHLVKNPTDGSLWIKKPRKKTKVEEMVRLLPLPMSIMEKYQLPPSRKEIFKMPCYKTCSRIIAQLAKDSGIATHVTWHLARHTMATSVCLANGVTMESVSRILGHRSMRSTQIYAKVTQEKLSHELDALESRLSTISF